jgi:hypothetical protein
MKVSGYSKNPNNLLLLFSSAKTSKAKDLHVKRCTDLQSIRNWKTSVAV